MIGFMVGIEHYARLISFIIGMVDFDGVWECDNDWFLKCFSLRNVWKYIFLKNYFWYQHIKTIKKY
jgi:hypothetical protein